MDIATFKEKLKEAVYKHYYILQKQLPYMTGNLAYKALSIKQTPTGFNISIDLKKAPYAKYIDRPGYVSWGYWNGAVEDFIKALAREFGGTLS